MKRYMRSGRQQNSKSKINRIVEGQTDRPLVGGSSTMPLHSASSSGGDTQYSLVLSELTEHNKGEDDLLLLLLLYEFWQLSEEDRHRQPDRQSGLLCGRMWWVLLLAAAAAFILDPCSLVVQ